MKVRHISGFEKQTQFPSFNTNYEELLASFGESELGKIHLATPWSDLVRSFWFS